MANYTTSADIISSALFEAGEPTDGSSEYLSAATRALNRAYQAIWMGGSELDPTCNEEWLWLKSSTPGVITILPVIITSATVTNYSTSVTLGSSQSISLAGRYLKTDPNSDVFRISAHSAATATLTLDSPYTGSSGTGVGVRIYALEYDLPGDCLRPMSPMRIYRDNWNEVQGMSLSELDRLWPLTLLVSGVPLAFAQVSETRIRFSHGGSETNTTDYMRADFDYLQKPADLTNDVASIPVIPSHRRKVLADWVTYYVCVEKNDNRADVFGILGRSGLKAMAAENRHRWISLGREAGHITPRMGDMAPYMRPLRTASGAIIG